MADADWATAVDVQEGIRKMNLPKEKNRKSSNDSANGFEEFDEGNWNNYPI